MEKGDRGMVTGGREEISENARPEIIFEYAQLASNQFLHMLSQPETNFCERSA
jgi:hypothetical protein